MTPAARAAAAIAILDRITDGEPAEAALIHWSRGARYAGSGDRAAVRDLVFATLRRRRSRAALGGGTDGRALILGALRENGIDPSSIFTGQGHAPLALSEDETAAGRQPSAEEALDLPDWIADRLRADLGSAFGGVAAALRDRAPVWLRANLARTDRDGAAADLAREDILTEPSPLCPTALRVTAGERRVAASRAYTDGLVELQDLAPQTACAALPVEPGATVADLCAGGGGKSLALAARGARVTAWDIDAARMRDLPERATRAGVKVQIAQQRPSSLFNMVVLDVPCSGSGTWRRTPDAKWRLRPADLDALVATQAQILDDAASLVGPGGTLAYMTCSLFRAENDDQIADFCSRHRGFVVEQQRTMLPPRDGDGFHLSVLRALTHI